MTEFRVDNGIIYTKSNLCERMDVFEIVEKIPAGFIVWNIGANMGSDEYIPVAELTRPEDKDCCEINLNTLKAIRLDPEKVQRLRKAAGWGINSKATAEKAIRSKRRGYNSDNKRRQAERTIDIFREITA